MDAEFIDLTAENIADEHLCCIIRMKKPHTGVEAKREWLAARSLDNPSARISCIQLDHKERLE